MKRLIQPKYLPLLCGGLGLAGMLLRFWQLTTGFDEKGLLVQGHIAGILTWVLTAAAFAGVLAALRGAQKAPKTSEIFPASLLGAMATGAGCVGILVSSWAVFLQPQTTLIRITWMAGAAAILACGMLAWCRGKGLRPSFLLRSVVTLYFMFHLVYHYQLWFSETQLSLYAPQLLAQVLLILSSYHRTALESGVGNRKRYIFTSQLSAFFCLLAVPGAQHPLFYLTVAIWLLADAGSLQPRETETDV